MGEQVQGFGLIESVVEKPQETCSSCALELSKVQIGRRKRPSSESIRNRRRARVSRGVRQNSTHEKETRASYTLRFDDTRETPQCRRCAALVMPRGVEEVRERNHRAPVSTVTRPFPTHEARCSCRRRTLSISPKPDTVQSQTTNVES